MAQQFGWDQLTDEEWDELYYSVEKGQAPLGLPIRYPGESDGDYKKRAVQSAYAQVENQIIPAILDGRKQDAQQRKVQGEEDRRATMERDLQAFYQEMLQPLDMKDPGVRAIMADIQGRASSDARLRGISGGLADSTTSRAMTNAALNMEMQRKQMGIGALTAGLSDARQLQQWRAQQEEMARQQRLAAAEAQYAAGKEQGQAIMGLTGGIAGTIIGGYFGGPQGAQAGGQAGSMGGAAMGGLMSGPSPSGQGYTGTYTPSGGLGGNPYRGGGV